MFLKITISAFPSTDHKWISIIGIYLLLKLFFFYYELSEYGKYQLIYVYCSRLKNKL